MLVCSRFIQPQQHQQQFVIHYSEIRSLVIPVDKKKRREFVTLGTLLPLFKYLVVHCMYESVWLHVAAVLKELLSLWVEANSLISVHLCSTGRKLTDVNMTLEPLYSPAGSPLVVKYDLLTCTLSCKVTPAASTATCMHIFNMFLLQYCDVCHYSLV